MSVSQQELAKGNIAKGGIGWEVIDDLEFGDESCAHYKPEPYGNAITIHIWDDPNMITAWFQGEGDKNEMLASEGFAEVINLLNCIVD